MLFLFKKKKLIVNTFISEKYDKVFKYFPIDYAEEFYPKWWKDLPKPKLNYDVMSPEKNMKTCPGFIKHYKKGFILPMWSDLMIQTNNEFKEYRYQFSDEMSSCESHENEQFRGFYENSINVKIGSPWLIESEKNIFFTVLPAFWNHAEPLDYKIAIGTVDYYHQHVSHINTFIDGTKNILIPVGQPMTHTIPLTDRDILINREIISEKEWKSAKWTNKIEPRRMSFFNDFNKFKKEKYKKSKCPFHIIKKW